MNETYVELKLEIDEEVESALDKILSGCLPHENYNKEVALEVFRELQRIVTQEEMSGTYYPIYKILSSLTKTNYRIKSYNATFKRSILEDSLAVTLEDLVKNPYLNMQEMVHNLGLDIDLSLADGLRKAQDLLYTETLEKFDYLTELEIPTEDAYAYLDILKQVITSNLTKQAIQMQAMILKDGIVYRRKTYLGISDHDKFVTEVYPWIRNRFVGFLDDKITAVELRTMEDYEDMVAKDDGAIKPISKFGYEPIDSVTSISTSDVITIVGDEAVGKTTMMTDLAYNAITSGKSVLFMTGESKVQKIKYMLISKHAYFLHGVELNPKEIAEYSKLQTEEGLIVRDAIKDLIENPNHGTLSMKREFYYETFYEEVEDYCRKYENMGLILVDHADRLKSKNTFTERGILKTQKERVDALYTQAVDISDAYPIAVVILAHTSSDATKALAKDKDPGVRIGASSSSTTKDADMVLLLSKNEVLKAQGHIRVAVTKLREHTPIKPFILKINGEPARIVYDENIQHTDGEIEDNTLDLID